MGDFGTLEQGYLDGGHAAPEPRDRVSAVEGVLGREVSRSSKRRQDLGCDRGRRHGRGWPVRGQRTRTNARTRKGPRRAIKKNA